jgi:hypothetical protein
VISHVKLAAGRNNRLDAGASSMICSYHHGAGVASAIDRRILFTLSFRGVKDESQSDETKQREHDEHDQQHDAGLVVLCGVHRQIIGRLGVILKPGLAVRTPTARFRALGVSLPLFQAQRVRRIQCRSAPGRNQCRSQRGRAEDQCGDHDCRRIHRLDVVQL